MQSLSNIRCTGGKAGIFPCHKVDLASFTPLTDIGASFVNDVWGWTDPQTGRQIAIVGLIEGTAFIDVTDGLNPVHLGNLAPVLPGDFGNLWGDIRVYGNYAYIGTEAADLDNYFNNGFFSGNGIQIVDMTQFRGVNSPIDVTETNRISDLTNSHNLSVNVDSGRLYVAGAFIGLEQCALESLENGNPFNGDGSSLIYDLAANPANPEFIGCLTGGGYNHDVQCVIYHGPDGNFRGREICIGSNESAMVIYDATDAANPVVLDSVTYLDVPFFDGSNPFPNYYTHQGWLSEDHSFFFLGDELDEYAGSVGERTTYIWDLANLTDAELIGVHSDGNTSIDHNMFVHEGLLYQANYTSGLWIYDAWKADKGRVTMRGYFDVFPADDRTDFYGSWGNYPYFGDGKVIVTSSDEGVFVLQSRAKSSSTNRGQQKGRLR